MEEAVALLAEHGAEAKILAGGQSLVPMMNFRLLRPALVVDVNRIPVLAGITATDDGLVLGGMTRHAALESSRLVRERAPLIAEVVPFIGHPAIRNRGTLGGSVAHADPAAELPVALLALDASVRAHSARGVRDIPADQFFVSPLTTALAPDEILTAIRIPVPAASVGWAFFEFARRHGDFALVAVAVTMRVEAGLIADPVRIALGGVAGRPIRARRAEASLRGMPPTTGLLEAAAQEAAGEADPPSDIHGSAEYRRHLTRVFVRAALDRAHARASPDAAVSSNARKGTV